MQHRRYVLITLFTLLFSLLMSATYAQQLPDTDGDGIPDQQDQCPTIPGPAENNGCPFPTPVPPTPVPPAPDDRDGDGTSDGLDRCPDQGGHAANGGCPEGATTDRDGDGIEDSADQCPDTAGTAAAHGCQSSDQDGDGVTDDQDQCPDRAGINGGCPLPRLDPQGVCSIATTDATQVNIRENPSLDAEIVGRISPSGIYAVLDRQVNAEGEWFQIEGGWVFGEVIRVGGDCEQIGDGQAAVADGDLILPTSEQFIDLLYGELLNREDVERAGLEAGIDPALLPEIGDELDRGGGTLVDLAGILIGLNINPDAADTLLKNLYSDLLGREIEDRLTRYHLDPSLIDVVVGNYETGRTTQSGDLNGDGIPDLVVGAGEGEGSLISVYDGETGELIISFFAFDPAFRGGVRVAVGDVNGDGTPDIIAAAGEGSAPHVKVFDPETGEQLASFMAYDTSFTGGVYVAAGDLNGDGIADIVTAPGAGGHAHVKAFDGATFAPMHSFFAFEPTFAGAAQVAVSDFNSDGQNDIEVRIPGRIKVFDGASLSVLHSAFE